MAELSEEHGELPAMVGRVIENVLDQLSEGVRLIPDAEAHSKPLVVEGVHETLSIRFKKRPCSGD